MVGRIYGKGEFHPSNVSFKIVTSIQLQSDSGVDRSYNEVENVIAVVCWEICRLGSVDRR